MISACVNCRDDESTITRWLNCVVPHVDEIIICDTGSLDSTKDLIRNYNATIVLIEKPWTNFLDARNRFFELATHPFIIQFDVDEVLPMSFWVDLPKYIEVLSNGADSIRLKHYNDKAIFSTLDDLNERAKNLRQNFSAFSYSRDVMYRTDLPRNGIKFEIMRGRTGDIFNNLSTNAKPSMSAHPLIHSYPANHKIRNKEYHARKLLAYAKLTPGYWEHAWSTFLSENFTPTKIAEMKKETAGPDHAPHATWWSQVGRLQPVVQS